MSWRLARRAAISSPVVPAWPSMNTRDTGAFPGACEKPHMVTRHRRNLQGPGGQPAHLPLSEPMGGRGSTDGSAGKRPPQPTGDIVDLFRADAVCDPVFVPFDGVIKVEQCLA